MNFIKQRIFNGWTWRRILYLVLGTMVIIQSIAIKQWIGILFGSYFAGMGLFAIGCASGSCYYDHQYEQPGQNSEAILHEVNYEEVKEK